MRSAPRLPLAALMIAAAVALAACAPGPTATPPSTTSPATTTTTPADPVEVEPFRDDFDSPASLDSWSVLQGDRMSGGSAEVTVADGALRVVSPHAAWLGEAESVGVSRPVSGDVDVTARVRTTGIASERPTVDWSLAGLMLRDPEDGPADWIHWTVGEVEGPVLERKRTSAGRSVLDLIDLPDGEAVDLRLIRSGDVVVLAYRQGEAPWVIAYDYTWVDMPSTMELLLTAQSGGEGDHADLVAITDFVDVRPTAFDPAELAQLADRDASPLNA